MNKRVGRTINRCGKAKGDSCRADEEESYWERSRRILIVEDEAILGFEVAAMVKSLGHSVVAMAGNEAEAVRLNQRMKPDRVLMHVRLGRGPDGVHAAERILQQRSIPIIFCTGYSSDQRTMERIRNLRRSSLSLSRSRFPS